MNAENFTPGPWRLERYENSVGEIGARVVSADGQTICDNEPYYPKAVKEHDAAIIAAAPNLLALLKEAQEYLDILADDAREAGYPVRAENAIQLSKRCREAITEANLIQL